MRDVEIKRVYDAPEAADGYRVLVDRLWPRGITKERAHLSAWVKEVAPSTELRKWFSHDASRMVALLTRVQLSVPARPATMIWWPRYQGLTFFQLPSPVLHAPSSPGASASRIFNLARSNRVFTKAWLIWRTSAVSAILRF